MPKMPDQEPIQSPEEKETNFDNEQLMMRTVEEEMMQSYIDYAMSVIVWRALPDVRDGLKPVIRRILVTMNDMWLTAGSKYKKSMWVVGQALRDYHPHGDTSVYDAMVRLAQPFSMRYPLVDGQGNFWSIDGDGAAAARYTEARMTKIAQEMLDDIKMDTVDRRPNYDQSREEPISLPTKFPAHLCNGTMWIAVGMATNMPPHNLTEVINACLEYIDDLEVTVEEIMQHIKGPDFPTGWIIFDTPNINEVYAKWRWGITMRGRVHYEENKKKQDVIVITEMPYQVNKANLVAKIGELVNEKKIDGIVDITDESSKSIIRVTITLRKWVEKSHVLLRLYKYTDLQTNFNVNNVALVEKWRQPRNLNIRDLIVEFVDYRRIIVMKRSQYQLDKAESRLHILLWLKKATDILDEVIDTIRASQTRDEAKQSLMSKFEFSDEQAEYILMLRLQTLVGLELQKILDEIGDKQATIEYLKGLINDPKKLDGVVTDELLYMKDTYGDERRTEVSNDVDSIYSLNNDMKRLKKLDGLIQEDVLVWIWSDYRMKVLYQSRVMSLPDDTWTFAKTHNQEKVVVITDTGELVVERLKDLGKFTTQSEPMDPAKHYKLKGNLVFSETTAQDFDHLVILSNKNNVKKVSKELLFKLKKFPTTCMGLEDGETVIKVLPVKEDDKIWAISEEGSILLYPSSQIRAMWKTANGVKAIDLEDTDRVADVFIFRDEPFIFMHSDQQGKMVAVEDIYDQKRWKMKRWQKWRLAAALVMGQKLRGAIAIEEWWVQIQLESGRVDLFDSEKMALKMPDDGLAKITNGKIVKMRRNYEDKEARNDWDIELDNTDKKYKDRGKKKDD